MRKKAEHSRGYCTAKELVISNNRYISYRVRGKPNNNNSIISNIESNIHNNNDNMSWQHRRSSAIGSIFFSSKGGVWGGNFRGHRPATTSLAWIKAFIPIIDTVYAMILMLLKLHNFKFKLV